MEAAIVIRDYTHSNIVEVLLCDQEIQQDLMYEIEELESEFHSLEEDLDESIFDFIFNRLESGKFKDKFIYSRWDTMTI